MNPIVFYIVGFLLYWCFEYMHETYVLKRHWSSSKNRKALLLSVAWPITYSYRLYYLIRGK